MAYGTMEANGRQIYINLSLTLLNLHKANQKQYNTTVKTGLFELEIPTTCMHVLHNGGVLWYLDIATLLATFRFEKLKQYFDYSKRHGKNSPEQKWYYQQMFELYWYVVPYQDPIPGWKLCHQMNTI
jgi:hypothetical protein